MVGTCMKPGRHVKEGCGTDARSLLHKMKLIRLVPDLFQPKRQYVAFPVILWNFLQQIHPVPA
ncbi:hypothetical protein SAMN05216191_10277 [Paenibacillus jilunlii]|uniref:Uncharacterized protein n=1 Tax=Paenibacillus jilunlii TaxID=682956 RepID=A0A1G9IIW2_9BACL|nr:hypothetical protein SAMN05216191_10277 [Paenibacillus jilunlii]